MQIHFGKYKLWNKNNSCAVDTETWNKMQAMGQIWLAFLIHTRNIYTQLFGQFQQKTTGWLPQSVDIFY